MLTHAAPLRAGLLPPGPAGLLRAGTQRRPDPRLREGAASGGGGGSTLGASPSGAAGPSPAPRRSARLLQRGCGRPAARVHVSPRPLFTIGRAPRGASWGLSSYRGRVGRRWRPRRLQLPGCLCARRGRCWPIAEPSARD